MRRVVAEPHVFSEPRETILACNERATYVVGYPKNLVAMRLLLLVIAVLLNSEMASGKKKAKLVPARSWQAGRVAEVGSQVQHSAEGSYVDYTFTIETGNSVINGVQIHRLLRKFPLPKWNSRCEVAMGDSIQFAIHGGMLYIQGRDNGGDCELRIAHQSLRPDISKL
jgi:hypothetical protein